MSNRPDDSGRNRLQDYLEDRRADNPVARRQAAHSRLPTIHHPKIPVGVTHSAIGTSMLLSGNTSLPAMTTARTVSSSPSASSSTGLRPVQLQGLLVQEQHSGLRRPHDPIFDCPFNFLSCRTDIPERGRLDLSQSDPLRRHRTSKVHQLSLLRPAIPS